MINLTNISKAYEDTKVFQNYSLTIAAPGSTAFMGASGCGKTTLLNLIAGIIQPDSGTISGMQHRSRAMVFQEDRLLPWCTAWENVALVLADFNRAKAEARLQQLGLGKDVSHKRMNELSGGMQRRISLARALVVEADILLLDEPFKGLDADLKLEIMDLIKLEYKTKTIIMVSHDEAETSYMSDEVITLHHL
jgi:NitT/TauT family transport system ATP-binding protein